MTAVSAVVPGTLLAYAEQVPADDYSPPAALTARQLARQSLIVRFVAVGLGALALTMTVATLVEVLYSAPDWTIVLGCTVVALAAGTGGRLMWRTADPGDGRVLECGDSPGLRLLDPLASATGPVHVPLDDDSGSAIVVTNDGIHLPAGVSPRQGLSARLNTWVSTKQGLGTPLEVPCFLAWSEVETWSYYTAFKERSGSHELDLIGGRRLSISDETIGDGHVALLDAVRSVGRQHVEVSLPQDPGQDYSGL